MAKKTDTGSHVRLCIDAATWPRVPPWARRALSDLERRAARIRENLAAESPHGWMPPIDIHPRAWVRGRSTVDGRAWFVRRGGKWTAGVELPAQAAAYPEELLRGLLIHEFSHCFLRIEEMVDAIAKEDPSKPAAVADDGRPHDHAVDDACHVDVAAWFGPSVLTIPLRGELDLMPLSDPFLNRWADAGLPVDDEEQKREFLDAKIVFDRRVFLHALELRKRRHQ